MKGSTSSGEKALASEVGGSFFALLLGEFAALPPPIWWPLALGPKLGTITSNPALATASHDGWELLLKCIVLCWRDPKEAFRHHVPLVPCLLIVVPSNGGGGGEGDALGPRLAGCFRDKF